MSKAPLILGGVVLAGLALASFRARSAIASGPCLEQPPQDFLIRTIYLKTPNGLARAIAYRTEQYGYFPGFGDPKSNPHPPSYYAVGTTFMGIPVHLHRKVIPSLKCVEATIKTECGTSYQPKSLSGLRTYNSYHDNEVSNHVYGIALDIDPSLNPCCGCVGHWANDPRCADKSKSPYDRMVMPRCWVGVFERFGWYWLGHDPDIQDTMHFEFLGVPPS